MAVAPHFQAISLGLLVIGAAATPTNAQVVKSPVVETKISPAHAQAEFAAASKEMKRLVGEMTVLQAEYQQPGSDKKAVEAKFAITKDQAQTTSSRLETAAFALAMIEPRNPDAQQICGAVVAAALKVDDPFKAIKLTEMLSTAGAASGDVMLMGATAAISLSQLDEATIFLKKAIAAGIDRSKVDGLEQAIETERPKVDAEMLTRKAEAAADDLPRVKMTTSKGPIVIELFENEAPNSVANFIALVEKGFYNGTPFHRVIGGFMAQGGDPTGSGTGGPGHVIDCECEAPGARKHFLGTLSMAHAGKNTGGSQFFLTFRPTEHLDGKHTVFGRVIEGFDVLPQLNRTEGPLVSGQPPDTIVKAEVIRKRNHPYEPKTRPK